MSIKTLINNNGIEEIDGSTGLVVSAMSSNVGISPYRLDGGTNKSSPAGTAFSVDLPGFYWVSGSTTCTGTIASAAAYPGGMLGFGASNVLYSFMLTGSSPRPTGSSGIFIKNGVGIGSVTGSNVQGGGNCIGDKLTVPPGGSVMLISDGLHWVPMASSGSLMIEA